jgi:hypothetical protein
LVIFDQPKVVIHGTVFFIQDPSVTLAVGRGVELEQHVLNRVFCFHPAEIVLDKKGDSVQTSLIVIDGWQFAPLVNGIFFPRFEPVINI